MPYATQLLLVLTSLPSIEEEVGDRIRETFDSHVDRFDETVLRFLLSELSPCNAFEF